MPNVTIGHEAYKKIVSDRSPRSPVVKNCIYAFIIGGLICCLGQAFDDLYKHLGMSADDAAALKSATLIALAALATGLGLYEKLGRVAGAGSIVPITGFANSMAAPALEFKREGMVFGVGAKMFVIAGPVLVFGLLSSSVIGLIYWMLKLLNII